MENFVFQNTTKIVFGKGTENHVANEIKGLGKNVLLHYGGGSIKKYGLYDRIVASLKEAGLNFVELGGVQPNPRLSLVYKGIELCRENKIDFILAVGGGSVIDSAKAIAIGVPYQGDVWDFYTGKAQVEEALPIGVVLTIAAAGSESSPGSVITKEEGELKRDCLSDLIRPKFAILNPELTYTLPEEQTLYGAADIMAHLMERYFTQTKDVDFTDRLLEGALKTIIKNLPIVLKDPQNYGARAQIMWAGTVAHGDLLGTGRIGDWASHNIEHELSGIYDVAHGAGLAVIFPAWMKYVYKENIARFAQFAVRVWDVEADFNNLEEVALEGIRRIENFFKSVGLPVTLGELGIPEDKLELMAEKCTERGPVGNFKKLFKEDVLKIYRLAI
ncbi:MAG: iron-containing alcohol dehydrogenase [Halanaerobiales bacterium]|jgi:alcohol dehydrogenase YqhD (iron-dependent ADH family)|nr:iron-containing alcohol dehydrogenase [Halanaerobiales bacterium]HPZ63708.1 iron-containing alcohol dehydrogenase [Halanaerobiales bacterium]HQD04976.1 iron-containing alcohol dehydrogenase [Halanaerobiales bacterium]